MPLQPYAMRVPHHSRFFLYLKDASAGKCSFPYLSQVKNPVVFYPVIHFYLFYCEAVLRITNE